MGRKKKFEQAGEDADRLIAMAGGKTVEDEPAPDNDDIDFDDYVETEPEPEPDEREDFRHKYEVLQGKYSAETERLNSMLQTALDSQGKLMAEIETLKQVQPTRAAREDTFGDSDDDREVKTLQEEYPNLTKGFMALIRKELPNYVKGTEEKVDFVAKRLSENAKENYYKSLDSDLPEWRVLNEHKGFLDWLNIRDKYTGATRRDLLRNAFGKFDVELTKQFFKDFLEENPNAVPRRKQHKIEEDLAPDTSTGGTVPRTAPGITREYIEKFYKDRAMGKFDGTDEDAKKIEYRIMRAVREGKVRG